MAEIRRSRAMAWLLLKTMHHHHLFRRNVMARIENLTFTISLALCGLLTFASLAPLA